MMGFVHEIRKSYRTRSKGQDLINSVWPYRIDGTHEVYSMFLTRSTFFTVLFIFSSVLSAHEAGELVSITGVIKDDLYLAGGQVDLFATVEGDVVVAGGQLNLEGNIRADVIAAGGDIELRGTVADDARIAGGNVRVLAKIYDDLVAAGGRLQVGPTTEIGGSAWLSGGEVFVAGNVAQVLRANGGRVIVTGTIGGNAEIWAEHIEIRSSAIIKGNLNYKSSQPAMIAEGARIDGEVTHTPVEFPVAPVIAGVLFASIIILLSVVITGVVLYLVFPGVAENCSKTIRDKPWPSLGYGLAVFAAGPVVIVLLLSTGLGILLGEVMASKVGLLGGVTSFTFIFHCTSSDNAPSLIITFTVFCPEFPTSAE